jgi:hypothetical protein
MPIVDNWVGCLLVDAIFDSTYDVWFGFIDIMTIEKWIFMSSGGVTAALSTVVDGLTATQYLLSWCNPGRSRMCRNRIGA